MKKLVLGLVVLSVCLCATQALAGKHTRIINAGNIPPPPAPKALPYWTVEAVDQESKTITLTKSDGKDSEKYKVTAMTKITISGQPDKLENVQTGMKAENLTVSAGSLSALSLVKIKESGGGKKNK